MIKAKKTATSGKKTRKAATPRKATATKTTPGKSAVKAVPKKVTKPKSTTKPKAGTAKRKLKNYSPRSRYTSFKVGDRVQFRRIKNWESNAELEKIIGVVIDKIDDKKLGLKFIEVQFDLRESLPFVEDVIRIRRFVVK